MSIEMIRRSTQRSEWSSGKDAVVQHGNSSFISNRNIVINDLDNDVSNQSKLKSSRKCQLRKYCPITIPCCQGMILGMLTAGLILAVLIALWLKSKHVTSTTSNVAAQILNTASVTTQTTSTSSTATTSTVSTSTTRSSTSTTSTTTSITTVTTTSVTTSTTSKTTSTTSSATTASTTGSTTTPSCSSPNAVGQIFSATSNTALTTYTLYTYGFTANSSLATLTFAMKGDRGPGQRYWLLDNISVNHTNTSTDVLINGGFETGDFTGWTQYCATDTNCGGTAAYGQVTSSPCYSGSYCYMDECASYYDYLAQSFATMSGDYYIVSFYLRIYSGGGGPYTIYAMLT